MDNRKGKGIGSEQMMARLAMSCVVVALAAPAAAADAPLGRLFFTPSQRASLDVARSQRTRAAVATERIEEEAQPVPQTITYGGMVRRSDGRTTVWLNDRAIDDRNPAGKSTIVRRVRPDGAVTLEVPQSNRRVELKVGQSVEVLSGSIGEAYRQRPAEGGGKEANNEAKDNKTATNATQKRASRGDGEQRRPEPDESAAVPEPAPAGAGSR